MKILVVCKRQYTGRDLLDDQYGRLFEIPEELARLGHQVKGLAVSYRRRNEGVFTPKDVEWQSFNALPIIGHAKIIKAIRTAIAQFDPDIIWASSDASIVHCSATACNEQEKPFVVDFYDNYGSFMLTKLPLMKKMLYSACLKSVGITAVTQLLSEHLRDRGISQGIPISVLGNGINASLFYVRETGACRQALSLPAEALLVGTAGALDSSRGIRMLFDAFEIASRELDNLHLVVAGPRDGTIDAYTNPRIIDLGNRSPTDIPVVLGALDLAIICNLDSDFGRFCYPQKLEEMLACRLPFLAANVGELARVLPLSHQFQARSSTDLAKKILQSFSGENTQEQIKASTWKQRAEALATFFDTVKTFDR